MTRSEMTRSEMTRSETSRRHDAEYVLPLRWDGPAEADAAAITELGAYLSWLSARVDVTVVDGSSPERRRHHAERWIDARVLAPEVPGRNGKASGAVTGMRSARHPLIVIADDDVRYDDAALAAVLRRLERADLVRPQNVWLAWPWHARWDTGRTLVNRAFGGDYSGTLALRADAAPAGYDTDVLFENLELERTVRAAGGTVDIARDLFVGRLPAGRGRFWEQRVRQAYDGFAQPVRLAAELLLLPAAIVAARRRPRALLGAVLGLLALAELGRRRGGGRRVYVRSASAWAVPWAVERGIAVWIAVGHRLLGGVPYRGERLRRAANSSRVLRRRARGTDPAGAREKRGNR